MPSCQAPCAAQHPVPAPTPGGWFRHVQSIAEWWGRDQRSLPGCPRALGRKKLLSCFLLPFPLRLGSRQGCSCSPGKADPVHLGRKEPAHLGRRQRSRSWAPWQGGGPSRSRPRTASQTPPSPSTLRARQEGAQNTALRTTPLPHPLHGEGRRALQAPLTPVQQQRRRQQHQAAAGGAAALLNSESGQAPPSPSCGQGAAEDSREGASFGSPTVQQPGQHHA